MKNYKKQSFKSKEEWLQNRGIGGSDAAAIVNESKWLSADDVYNRIVLNKNKKISTNKRMEEGTVAEEHIRALWALDHPQFKIKNPPKKAHWLFRRKDYPLLTCTPDGLFEHNGKKYGLEIKDVELIKSDVKEQWESNILPSQYYFQVLHYLVVLNDLDGVCLNAHLKYFYFNEEKNEWEFSHAVDKDYWVYRDEITEHIKYLEKKEIDFIENNINKRKRPKTIIKLGV